MGDEDLFGDISDPDVEGWVSRASRLSLDEYVACVASAATQNEVLFALEAAMQSARTNLVEATRDVAVRRFPVAAKGSSIDQLDGRTADRRRTEILKAAAGIELGADTKAAWRTYLIENGAHPAEVVAELAARIFDETAAGEAFDRPVDLQGLGRLAMDRPSLFAAISRTAPDRLAARVRALTLRDDVTKGALGNLYWVVYASDRLAAEVLVAEAGAVLASQASIDLLSVLRASGVSDGSLERMRAISEVHEALSRGTERGEPLMAQGIHRHLLDLATRYPNDWAEYMRIALWKRGADSFLVQPTLSAAKRSERVVAVLHEILERAHPILRDRARALLVLIDGTGERPSRLALLRLVELVDGAGAFPHPLQVRSSTWLGSLELEALLRGRIERAAARLARDLPERMSRNEEKITTRILTMIEDGLRDASEVAAEATEVGRRVEVECRSRELSRPQEHADGSDIAWMLDVDVPGIIRFRHAEFTQSKKALREGGKFVDKWDVDVAQLRTMRARSETAVYWLYGADGAIHVVPARLLEAILVGEGREGQDSARFDLAHVRSMAIPISQFLVDLFAGAWLGTTTERALRIARGDDDDRPDVLFQVSVRAKAAD